MSRVGTQFFGSADTGVIQATVELPVGTRVEETAAAGRQLVERLAAVIRPEERTHLYFRAGQTSEGFGSASGQTEGSHVIILGARLVSKDERSRGVKEISEQVADVVRRYPAVVKLTLSTQDPIDAMLLGGGKEISFDVEGHDLERSDALARRIFNIVRLVPGVRNAIISREVGRPELRVAVDRLKAAALGLNISDIAQTLRMQFYGSTATQFREAEHDYDIFPRLAEPFRRDVTDLANTVITTPAGAQVPLANIATIEETTGPVEIERRNQERVVKVQAETLGRSLGEVTADIKKQVDELEVPKDLKVTVGGLSKEQTEAFGYLTEAFVLGMVLVYMIMASQFESLRDPFVIMFSVPFAFVGVALLFWLTGMPFDVSGFLGLVMLVGVVVNNAIVLVDYINILRARGRAVVEAVVEGGERRLRPVLITSITTIFGVLPMALSTKEGAEQMRPLAVAVIGGLTVSMLVTLVLVPVIYSLFEERRASARGSET
jgi:HAE1 family hydrophobic/amphiphilic exporter-1